MADRQIGLRKKTRPFTAVPNDTVDDWTIGFRELGVLTRILRMPDGFVIRSEQLAGEGKGQTRRGREPAREGREAVRTALRNLAMAGYYRLGRCRLLSGAFVMTTDASEEPEQAWAEQAAVFSGKPVPMVEQEDGSFMVKYPDGSLLPDGFPPPAGAGRDEPASGDEPSQTPKTGFRAPGNRAPGKAAPGEAEPGACAPNKKMVTEDGYQDSVPASQVRPDGTEVDAQLTIDGDAEALKKEKTAEETAVATAFGIARDWVAYRKRINKPIGASRPLHQVKDLLVSFVRAGYTEEELKRALNGLGEALPFKAQMQRALDTIRDHKTPGTNGRPAQRGGGHGPMAGTNLHIDDLTPQQRAAENPFNGASRQSDYMTGATA